MIRCMIPIDLLINYLVIDTQNDHTLINLYRLPESAIRGTTVFNNQVKPVKYVQWARHWSLIIQTYQRDNTN